jgi:hypothetical protein
MTPIIFGGAARVFAPQWHFAHILPVLLLIRIGQGHRKFQE